MTPPQYRCGRCGRIVVVTGTTIESRDRARRRLLDLCRRGDRRVSGHEANLIYRAGF